MTTILQIYFCYSLLKLLVLEFYGGISLGYALLSVYQILEKPVLTLLFPASL